SRNNLQDHELFDGGRPEFLNINERVFSALENDYDAGYTWDPALKKPMSKEDSMAQDEQSLEPESEFDY
ncbi:MAG: hypothetical protein RSF90_06995, partial [Pygmaiobacter sp.]